jgi:hypothetical protein
MAAPILGEPVSIPAALANAMRAYDLPRNSAPVVHHIGGWGNHKEGLEFSSMEMKATEQKQDSARQYTNLDNRYGKIGISAVAAAVRHQGELRNTAATHSELDDHD